CNPSAYSLQNIIEKIETDGLNPQKNDNSMRIDEKLPLKECASAGGKTSKEHMNRATTRNLDSNMELKMAINMLKKIDAGRFVTTRNTIVLKNNIGIEDNFKWILMQRKRIRVSLIFLLKRDGPNMTVEFKLWIEEK
ncbi:hypothetical protein ACJX0J_022524, partial [Zea mays]